MMKPASATERIRAVRGATTLPEDTSETMAIEVSKMLETLVKRNAIAPDDIVSVFFTVTEDLHSISPARIARRVLPWKGVALFSAVEPRIENQPEKAVRVLIQFYTSKTPDDLTHIYLNEARHLRPDRQSQGAASAPLGSTNVLFDNSATMLE
jgi:chorismate mutase